MAEKKTEYADADRILLLYTPARRLVRRLHRAGDGPVRFFFEEQETGLAQELQIILVRKGKDWYLGQECLSGEHPCYRETGAHEKLIFLISEELRTLEPTHRCLPIMDTGIEIGRAFQNMVFYECYALVNACHLQLFYGGESWGIGKITGAVYVNGKLAEKKQPLKSGDTIDVYGLHMLLLSGILVCTCLCGLCRIADEKKDLSLLSGRKTAPTQRKMLQLGRRRDQFLEFHKGEVEVILPKPVKHEAEQPLLLGLGPSVTMVLPMLIMAALSSSLMGGMGKGFYYLSVVMSGCSAALALFWGVVNHFYRKRFRRLQERGRRRQYQEYLEELGSKMEKWQQENREVLNEKYPPLSQLLDGKEAFVLWNRYYRQDDFLFLRLGTGRASFQVRMKLQGKENTLLSDKETLAAQELIGRFAKIEEVPAGIDLYKMRQIGIGGAGSCRDAYGILLEIMGQLAACHCYTEVKVACFYDNSRKEDKQIADCLKWMPHCWSKGKKERFLAGDEQEAAEILPVLTTAIEGGAEKGKDGCSIPWYVVVVLNKEILAGELLYQRLTAEIDSGPVSAIFVEKERSALPKSCRYLLFREQTFLQMVCYEEAVWQKEILEDPCETQDLEAYLRSMSGFSVKEEREEEKLPETVSFLELYQCKEVEELDCRQRWEQGHPEKRLRVPIGVRTGGMSVYLDVHEKFHGPHGLIAGTTGSGKSELIQTYLLSMAVSFAPDMLNFCVIDYKGGGTGNALVELPHCAGVISNLSGREICRALAAIASENQKRQQQLSRAGVNHVDDYLSLYREGKVIKPMPHLILVVDEFAELRREEPEFMQEIISLSQVGRSLGIHLLLATQKPAGTVDDKIWSNSRFRLCLRVQDRQDSMDMLHVPDAASLTTPGQGYLQIGNQESCELIQAGYSAGIYQPEKETSKPAALITMTGKSMITPDTVSGKRNSQMETVISYVNQTAQQKGYQKAEQLWLEEMPDFLTLEKLSEYFDGESYTERQGELLLGLCDDPGNQRQFPLIYRPQEQGHLAICSGPAAGKSTLLQTICWQITACSDPEEALLVLAAIGQENHDCFGEMPGCLGILREPEEKEIFFYHVEQMMLERKRQLSGISCQVYNHSGRKKLPLIFFLIDGYGALRRILSEQQEELLYRIACVGVTYGIYLVVTASGAGDFPGKFFEKIKTTLALEMSDRFQYGDVLRRYHIRILPKENGKGRGLCRIGETVLEFQGALCMEEADDYLRMQKIASVAKMQANNGKESGQQVRKFPVICRNADYRIFLQMMGNFKKKKELPLGYDLMTGEPVGLSLQAGRHLVITGREGSGRRTLLYCLLHGMKEMGYRVILLDLSGVMEERIIAEQGKNSSKDGNGLGEIEIISEGGKILAWQEQQEGNAVSKGNPTCVVIADFGSFCNWLSLSGADRAQRQQFWQEAAAGKRGLFLAGILMREQEQQAYGTLFFTVLQKSAEGIHIGGNVTEQRVFAYMDLSYSQQNQQERAGIAYYCSKTAGRTRKVWLPPWKKEEEV